MSSEERIADILFSYREARRRGDELYPEDVLREHPDLA